MARSSVLGSATRVEPDAADRRSVADVGRAVATDAQVVLRLADGTEILLPDAMIRILRASADELGAGHAVTVLASEVLLTPAEAGELLGLSRPYLARLLDDHQLPAEYLPGSRHRVVRLADLLEFQARRERRREGRQRISELIEDHELPY